MADWDANSAQLSANLKTVLTRVRDAAFRRDPPSLEAAKSWHVEMMRGLEAPDPSWVGRFRGEPGLEGLGVRIGDHQGAPSKEVAGELKAFLDTLNFALSQLDQEIAPGADLTSDTLNAVLDLCGWTHAEWVRIHPFANGNGRTARIWANAIAMRYGLPPFVVLRPRPAREAYARAGAAAMQGRWEETADLMRNLLDAYV